MEIRTDVYRTAEPQTRSVSQNRSQPQAEAAQIVQESSPRREFLNAMNLMHTASAIVQEALNASSKLRSLAMTTVFDGAPNYAEVAKTVAGIQTSLEQLGQPVVIPEVSEKKAPSADVAEIRSSVDKLGTMAGEKKVDPELLSQIEKSLQRAKTSIDNRIDAAGKEYGFRDFLSAGSVELSKAVAANPSQALAAQGNIVQESAGVLLR
jgi:hypothetical protein